MSRKRAIASLVGLALAGLWWATESATIPDLAIGQGGAITTGPPTDHAGHTTAGELKALLETVDVVPERVRVAGYDRECGSEGACHFGQAWTDDHPGVGGRNGCDTRNDVLRSSLRDITVKPGTNDCVILTGILDEPYTGQTIKFDRQNARAVQIDHLYPLAAAWDLGAAEWSLERRVEFANDQELNLIAVDGSANASKGDRGPGEWLPINRAYVCDYLAAYLRVAIAYDLPITEADVDAVDVGTSTCRSDDS